MVSASTMSDDAETFVKNMIDIGKGELALDIGPVTIEAFRSELEGAGTIVWNGPLGAFEMAPFSNGTKAIAEAISSSSAFTLVGGGDTDRALTKYGLKGAISFVSSGGGAFLDALAGKELPAVLALDMSERIEEEVKRVI